MTLAWTPPRFGSGIGRTELWNALLALAGQPVPLGGTDATLAFALAEPPGGESWVALFRLRPFPQPLFVRVEDYPFATAFGVALAAADLPALPEGLRDALFQGIFASIRPMLPHSFAERLEPAGQGPAGGFAEAGADAVQWFGVRLAQANGFAVALTVGCDRALATALLPDPARPATEAGQMLAQQINVPADTTLGSITLLRRELASLEPGAVVVLEEGAGLSVRVRVGESLYDFTDTGAGWRSSGAIPAARFHPRTTVHRTDEDATMDDNQTLPAVADEPAFADDLRVAIDFDLGRSMVPLSIVGQWQAGALIDLTPPQIGEGLAVTIRANGDVVGTGDVVRIDDRLAVRITRFTLR